MSADQPLVSVLITNYNCGHYLQEAIDSALNQTYSPIETIVVDDGSTDDSRELLASYKDRIIPVFKENGGQASAINAGFPISQGEIICSLDGDDVWLPTKVEEVVKAANTYPNA
ncbi:MAG: glycosyltransferase family 2 protein, partial [Microcystaceae cyanobacterium]